MKRQELTDLEQLYWGLGFLQRCSNSLFTSELRRFHESFQRSC